MVQINWQNSSRNLLIVGLAFALSSIAQAVDDRPMDVTKRYSVVGVIAGASGGGNAIGIAVLKDQQTERSLTLSIGDVLPADRRFRVKAMERSEVTVTDGETELVLEVKQETRDQRATQELPSFAERFYRINQFGDDQVDGELTDSWNPVNEIYDARNPDRPQTWPRPVDENRRRMVVNGVAVDPWTGVPINDEPRYEVNGERWQRVDNSRPGWQNNRRGDSPRYRPLDNGLDRDRPPQVETSYEPTTEVREEFIPGEGWVTVPVEQNREDSGAAEDFEEDPSGYDDDGYDLDSNY